LINPGEASLYPDIFIPIKRSNIIKVEIYINLLIKKYDVKGFYWFLKKSIKSGSFSPFALNYPPPIVMVISRPILYKKSS